ncbi:MULTISPECIES: translation initiation factor IF-2 [unclassified Methanoregula]|uniref:translation initiation factor IF-2 n=1 Tax=unclassified Methanoregula TaxID=2649730 RepID=UPI0009C74A3C|nr:MULTISPECIES: translation initiation factor IF-2 [unclassified Methanoregula]OPX64157.1 MAG: putative translation initiation factor IF-2 [Methanoregula sp. PtaB.Bin085]OPY34723.1 MAG: putative translation initiation factor IF-2 [Methanoregula sp. PtaU1.Bin006]
MADNPKIRTPIVCVMGHVDHGKTSLLDRIRGSSVVSSEVGAITQHIGATIVPIDAIRSMSGTMGKAPINIPGLLFIDTPGHHAFTTLRARGGALADMAILVVDISQGFQPQTIEALQILRNCKTPFVIAATKIDRIHGWRVNENETFVSSFTKQNERVKGDVENKTYEIVGKLAELGFSADRFDRVADFQRNLAIVPVSAHTGEGIADLLLVMIGLAQRYMSDELKLSVEGPGAGTVLEVKEERGLGTTLDVILYDGTLAVGDEIAVATQKDVLVTKVRSLLKPRPMKEILVEDRFERVKSVAAAAGIKVTAPDLEGVIAGSPFFVIRNNREEVEARIKKEMTEIHVNLSEEGISIKADTIGALEALCKELEGKEIGVMRAEVGPVSRLNLIETETVKNPMFRVLLSFNTPILPDAAEMLKNPLYTQVKVFEGRVIYQLIDQYVEWRDEQKRLQEKQRFEHVVMPAKIRLLPDCVFRQSNPAVVGVRVLGGKLRSDVDLIKPDGKKVGHLKTMQLRQESIREADAGLEVAISIEGATVGRQVSVGDDLLVDVPERHIKVLEKEMIKTLNTSTQEILSEFTTMKRKADPFWGR